MKYAHSAWSTERSSWRLVIQLNLLHSIFRILDALQAEMDNVHPKTDNNELIDIDGPQKAPCPQTLPWVVEHDLLWQGENERMATHRKSPQRIIVHQVIWCRHYAHLSKTATITSSFRLWCSVDERDFYIEGWQLCCMLHQTIMPIIYDNRCSLPAAGKYDRGKIYLNRDPGSCPFLRLNLPYGHRRCCADLQFCLWSPDSRCKLLIHCHWPFFWVNVVAVLLWYLQIRVCVYLWPYTDYVQSKVASFTHSILSCRILLHVRNADRAT